MNAPDQPRYTGLWKIVPADPSDTGALTDSELIGISIIVGHNAGEPHDDVNVYWRARMKIQPQVRIALDEGES